MRELFLWAFVFPLVIMASAVAIRATTPAPLVTLRIINGETWVCTPYTHGRSCKTAEQVQRFILDNARDDCQ